MVCHHRSPTRCQARKQNEAKLQVMRPHHTSAGASVLIHSTGGSWGDNNPGRREPSPDRSHTPNTRRYPEQETRPHSYITEAISNTIRHPDHTRNIKKPHANRIVYISCQDYSVEYVQTCEVPNRPRWLRNAEGSRFVCDSTAVLNPLAVHLFKSA